MVDSDNNLSPRPSKSERKREVLALQKLGEILVELAPTQLAQISLDPILAEAIATAQSLTSREAKRRQLQYIGRIMCEVDTAAIEDALTTIKRKDQQVNARFHQAERWRDELIAQGDVKIQEFIENYVTADRQHLRQLIRKIQQDNLKNKNSGAKTELFRYIRQMLN